MRTNIGSISYMPKNAFNKIQHSFSNNFVIKMEIEEYTPKIGISS